MKQDGFKHNGAQSGSNDASNTTWNCTYNYNYYTNTNPEGDKYHYQQIYGPGPNGYYDYWNNNKHWWNGNDPLIGKNTSIVDTINNIFHSSKPVECHILHNNNRLKAHNGNKVYLKNGDEFQIEMFNPNTFTYGVKIKINGEYISASKLVLYPGQRLKLDRYLDENKKFVFTTYEVEDTKAVSEAILNNGFIELEFYKEYKKISKFIPQTYTFYDQSYKSLNNDIIGQSTYNTYCSLDSLNTKSLDDNPILKDMEESILREFKETGIIGKGDKSETEFKDVDINFENKYDQMVHFHILPLSQKPIEAKDLIIHCTQCGKKAKKDHKYCSSCGTKL